MIVGNGGTIKSVEIGKAVSSLQGDQTEGRIAMDKGAHEEAGHVNAGMARVGGVDNAAHPRVDAADAGRPSNRVPSAREASAPEGGHSGIFETVAGFGCKR